MPASPIQGNNSLQEMTKSLLQTFDTNRDGSLSSDEFGQFLTRLVASLNTGTTVTGNRPSALAKASLPNANVGPGKGRLEGFDDRKLADPNHQSVKYKFARVAQSFDLSAVKDKAAAEAVLQQMRPELEKSGIKVFDVKGDRIEVEDEPGKRTWIDVVRGANSGSPAFQWLVG